MVNNKRRVNDSIRHRLRRIRLLKGLALGEAANRAGIPLSSYSCLESGHYAISLENLSRMIEALETDINQVWPFGNAHLEERHDAYSRQIQSLRMNEVMSLSDASGIALFAIRENYCRVLLYQALSDSEIDSFVYSLQKGDCPQQGQWFSTVLDDTEFHLFLGTKECPSFVEQLIEHYLIIWRRVFLEEMHSVNVSAPNSPERVN